MASEQSDQYSTKQLFVLGTKQNAQRCIERLLGPETVENINKDVWTVYSDRELIKDIRMVQLKDVDFDIESSMNHQDMNLCSSGTSSDKTSFPWSPYQTPGHPERRKSENRFDADNGYESSDNIETRETDETVDIHVIVLDDHKDLNRKIVPFMVQFFLFPAVFLVAVDGENFRKDLYEKVIKETGAFAQMKQDVSSKLLLVNVSPQQSEEPSNHSKSSENIDELQFAVMDNYFGYHFFSCHINELLHKVKSLLRNTSALSKGNRSTVERIFQGTDKSSLFLEKNFHGFTEEIASLAEYKYLLCFESGRKEYVCKPEDLFNEFLRVLYKMLELKYETSSYEFMKRIAKPDDRRLLIDAFEATGLIRNDEGTQKCFILPFMSCETLPVFDEMNYMCETNTVRLTVDMEMIPALIASEILMNISKQGWKIASSGPELFGSNDSYLCVEGSHGLIVLFSAIQKVSYIYLCVLKSASHKECNCFVGIKGRLLESLRENVETDLKKYIEAHSPVAPCMSISGKHIQMKNSKRDLTTYSNDWIEVQTDKQTTFDLQNARYFADYTVEELLSPWFSSMAEEIEEKASRRLSDSFLADISELFGFGFKLFFVSLKVPSERLSQIEMENKGTRDSVYQMLLEWRKRDRPRASVASLRSAIKKSTHVTVNIHAFDEIARRHGLI